METRTPSAARDPAGTRGKRADVLPQTAFGKKRPNPFCVAGCTSQANSHEPESIHASLLQIDKSGDAFRVIFQ